MELILDLRELTSLPTIDQTHVSEWTYSRRVRTPPYSPPLAPALLPPAANPITTTSHVMTETTPLITRKASSRSPSITTSSTFALSSSPKSRVPLILAISYASASGILSGMCLLFAKSGVELLLLTIGGKNQFWRWQAWLLILGLGVFALLQLWYLHKALILADPTLVCPRAFNLSFDRTIKSSWVVKWHSVSIICLPS